MDLTQLNFENEEEMELLNVDDLFSFNDVTYQPLLFDDLAINNNNSSPPSSPNEILQDEQEEEILNSSPLLTLLNQPIPLIKTEKFNLSQIPIQNKFQSVNQPQIKQEKAPQQLPPQIKQETKPQQEIQTKPKQRTKKKIIKIVKRKKQETQTTMITKKTNNSKSSKRGRSLKPNELEKRQKLASIRDIKNVKNLTKEERRLRRLERNRESARRTREKKKDEEFKQHREISALKSLVSNLKKQIEQKNEAISQLLNFLKKDKQPSEIDSTQQLSTLIQEMSPLEETIQNENPQFSVSRKRRHEKPQSQPLEQEPEQSNLQFQQQRGQKGNVSHKKYKHNNKFFNKQSKKNTIGFSLFIFCFIVGICFNLGDIGQNAGYDYSLSRIKLNEKNVDHFGYSYLTKDYHNGADTDADAVADVGAGADDNVGVGVGVGNGDSSDGSYEQLDHNADEQNLKTDNNRDLDNNHKIDSQENFKSYNIPKLTINV
ncbi:basic-leucine zipper transcription factor f-related [Anaeramoeba flamelloides]|uniref:Basic-leucine zipper transcription factor f-related n=1 Tax=Anaeramoeba flamelloides TaxID=1746091 RepID=A0ABQ8XQJ7_9EUKA|nr:basic-leucine zipper transcription factor f-related [Anaeramoeba flamelloides]